LLVFGGEKVVLQLAGQGNDWRWGGGQRGRRGGHQAL